MTDRRRLVLDLAATSRNWALTPEGEIRVAAATPVDWEVKVVNAPTSSDGDGPQGGSGESKQLIADAEVYFGFGITADLFQAARQIRWDVTSSSGGGLQVVVSGYVRESTAGGVDLTLRRTFRFALRPAGQLVERGQFAGHRHQGETPRHSLYLPSRVRRHDLHHELPDAVRDEVGQPRTMFNDMAQPIQSHGAMVQRRRVLHGYGQRRATRLIMQHLERTQTDSGISVEVREADFLPGIRFVTSPGHVC